MSNSIGFFFRFFRVLVVLAIAVMIAFFLFQLKREPEKKEIKTKVPSVTVMAVTPVSKAMIVESFGTVKPRTSLKIAAEVPGRINYIHPLFIEGGFLKKGDLLLQIDDESFKLDRRSASVRISQAKVDLKRLDLDIANLKKDLGLARENLDLAASELDRLKALSSRQFASINNFEKAKQQHLAAKSQLQGIENQLALSDTLKEQKRAALSMARVAYEQADLAVSKTKIESPFDGYILEKYAQTGEVINMGQLLGIMYQKDQLDVDVNISMEKIKWFAAEFENGVMPKAIVRMNHLANEKSIFWNARVARIKARVDEGTRTLPMTLEIQMDANRKSSPFDLKPGTFVRCSIIGQSYDQIYVIPRHLLKSDDDLYTFYQDRLKVVDVDILRKFEEEVYIRGGLNPGDRIITSPLPGAVDGMALSIKINGDD